MIFWFYLLRNSQVLDNSPTTVELVTWLDLRVLLDLRDLHDLTIMTYLSLGIELNNVCDLLQYHVLHDSVPK